MVSFSCEGCGDILTKKKLDAHRNRCHAEFTCIDCMQTFDGTAYRSHTSCISEAQKYQGALYREKKPHKAYVEDADDEGTDAIPAAAPPRVPSPPPADAEVNVFDFLVDSETPNLSKVDLDAMVEDTVAKSESVASESGQSAVTAVTAFETPAPKKKKDKKRKHLHVETNDLALVHVPRDDEIMTDAPPVLHSGLTGGLKNLLAHPGVFPPSPDYSGGDADVVSPGSPLKRTKHAKHDRRGAMTSIMAMIAKPKPKPKPKTKSKKKEKKAKKMLEYKQDDNQVVLYKNPADTDLFMSLINKGPESQRGCSVNKCLKRYHRERSTQGIARGRGKEEKDLFRALRLKRNDRGEVVVFFE